MMSKTAVISVTEKSDSTAPRRLVHHATRIPVRTTMATDATHDFRPSLTRGQSIPRPTYNVRSSCIGIGLSIFALVVLLVALALW